MIFREIFGLNYDPFAPASPAVVAEPVRSALTQMTHEFGRGAQAVVVVGAAGAGKSLLLRLIQDAYGRQNHSVSRVDMAALFPSALNDDPDLLLIDEADSADPSVLHAALSEERETPRKVVLACRPDAATRLCGTLCAVPIHLAPLSAAQAKDFIIERVTNAGRADLFAPAALNRLIEASAGSPQALRALAGMAMFLAAYAQAFQIDVAHVEEAVRSQGGFLPAEARSDDVAVNVQMQSVAHIEQPQMLSALLVPATESRPERRRRFSLMSARRELAAAAVLLVAIAVPGSLLFGTEGDRPVPVRLISVAPAPAIRGAARSAANSLVGLDRVAKAVLPGKLVLAIVPLVPLQQISIGPAETRAPSPPRVERRTVMSLATAMVAAPTPPTVTSIPGSQAVIVPPPPAPTREAQNTAREAARELLAQDADERAFGSTPPRTIPAVPPKYMNANAMALALVDIAQQAGLMDDDEFVAFRACVFRRVSPGSAEQRAFWNAVERCLR